MQAKEFEVENVAVFYRNTITELLPVVEDFQLFDLKEVIVLSRNSADSIVGGNYQLSNLNMFVGYLEELKKKVDDRLKQSFEEERDDIARFLVGINNVLVTILQGDVVADIRERIQSLQQTLIALGHNTYADGVYGPATERAIINYKTQRNLPQTTDLSAELLDRMEKEAKDFILSKTSPKIKEGTQYWILILPPDNWDVSKMSIGEKALFNTLDANGNKRYGYELLTRVEKGDMVLGFVRGSLQSMVAIFEVVEGAHKAERLGEWITMVIAEVLNPLIHFEQFIKDIDFAPQLLEVPDSIIAIDERIYSTILNTQQKPKFEKNGSDDEKEKEGDERTIKKSYHATLTTEGNHAETDDKLQFKNDITSLASVIALKDVKPPLAIGLFGNWGSGKSFFMEKLEKRIKTFTTSKREDVVKNVVHVKFNSWHYSDANLWASLITEIFDSLHAYSADNNKEEDLQKLSQTLHITGLQKEEAEKKKLQLEERIHQLKQKQEEKRQRLEDVSGIGLLKLVLSDALIKKDLQELNNDAVENLVKDRNKIDAYITQVQGGWNKAQYIWRSFKDMKGGRWVFVVAVALLAFSVSLFLKYNTVSDYWNNLSAGAVAVMSVVVTALAQFMKIISPALSAINTTVERLQHLRNTIGERQATDNSGLNSAELELKELTEALQSIDARIKETKQEISEIKSGKRLLEFIQNRSKDESYARQLGLISWIRKDFKRLDDLLRKQHTLNGEDKQKLNGEDIKLQIDRIVLYIDDLDRCKEDVVVKVLEAVHLLLAFPLFVVVVGVDPRWLNNALAKQYEAMFGTKAVNGKQKEGKLDKESNASAQNVATTYDYLEKIFQVPFALKPIDKGGQGDLIEYLLRHEMEKPAPVASSIAEKQTLKGDDNAGGQEEGKDVVFEPQPETTDTDTKQTGEAERKTESNKEEEPETVDVPEKITFSKGELAFMKTLSPIFGHTPRGINRYVNIYRIIRSHEGLKVAGVYDEDEYVPVLFILAIVVGYSGEVKNLIDGIEAAGDDELLQDVLEGIEELSPELRAAIYTCLTAKELNMPNEPFKRNLELISRFSFRTIMC